MQHEPLAWNDMVVPVAEHLGAAKWEHEKTRDLLRIQILISSLSLIALLYIAYRLT